MNSEPRRVLRILHVEDSELDHELTLAHLRRSGVEPVTRRVESAVELESALDEGSWDLILSDYNLPGFTGLHALDLVKARGEGTPFILVSGEIGEDVAVEAMRNGAADYLLKSNLKRLGAASLHAIEAHEVVKAKRAADRALEESQQRLRELAQHLQASVESERAAIAREIHDDVGGSLTALHFDLAWMGRHVKDPAVLERLSTAQETLASALEASKRIMQNLRPAILEQGLVAALQWMTARFERRTGVSCRFTASHEQMALPPLVPLVAYRTAQEALTNVSKHAQASSVTVDLTWAAGTLTLEISDNGRGLSQSDLAKARSFGIRGLHERAGTVGGWVDLTSSASGTTLILSIPIDSGAQVPAAMSESGHGATSPDTTQLWGPE